MGKKLKILFVCNKSPWPAREGGPIAMNQIIEGLADAGHKVKVLAINTNKYSVKPEEIPENYKQKTRIELVYVNLAFKPIPAFLNLFSAKSYHVERFITSAFEKKLKSVLQADDFDIVQFETLYQSPYIDLIRKMSKAKIVLRAHNIEHLIWKRVSENQSNPLKGFYIGHLAKTLENYEKKIISKFDGVLPITEKDATFFRKFTDKSVMALPFGLDVSKLNKISHEEPEKALFHIGSMNWLPNEEGIKWFIDQVWPKIEFNLPALKLYLAGREMPEWLNKLNRKNIIVVGEVEDAHEFIKSKAISIAPLFSGSGIRIKIIESMALGKAVVSTNVGAEGINVENGKNILLADKAEDFFNAIKQLFENNQLLNSLGENARELILSEHNTPKLISNLERFYRQIL